MGGCFDSRNLSRDHYVTRVACASLVDCLFQKLQTAQLQQRCTAPLVDHNNVLDTNQNFL